MVHLLSLSTSWGFHEDEEGGRTCPNSLSNLDKNAIVLCGMFFVASAELPMALWAIGEQPCRSLILTTADQAQWRDAFAPDNLTVADCWA